MAEDPNPTLRAQLVKDHDTLAPQIRGLPDIAATSVSPDMIAALHQQLTVRTRRRDLIQTVLDRLDHVVEDLTALEHDGWPAPVSVAVLDSGLFEELTGEQSDVEAAVAVFRQEADIVVGKPSFTKQDPPPAKGP